MRRSKRIHTYLKWQTWAVYGVLFGIAIPWYWPATETVQTNFGLPTWVLVTLTSSVTISFYTAWLLVFRWPSSEAESEDRHE